MKRVLRKISQDGVKGLTQSVRKKGYRKFVVSVGSRLPRIVDYLNPRIENLLIEFTNACNLNCRMCYSRNRERGFMDWGLYEKILQELPEINPAEVTLHYGGESLLHPNFEKMLEAIVTKHRKHSVGLFTNGMLLDEGIAKKVVQLGVDWITFSLEGFGEVNDAIRVGADYDKIQLNLMRLLRLRGEKKKPEISINITDQGQEIGDFCKYWLGLGKVDHITVNFCVSPKNFTLDNLSDYADSFKLREEKCCYSPFLEVGILWNGDVTPCCHDWQGKNIMGNIGEQKIAEVWKNARFKQLRRACLKNDFRDFPLCQNCNVWKYHFSPSYFMFGDMRITLEGTTQKYQRI